MGVGYFKKPLYGLLPDVIDIPVYTDDRGYVYCALDNMEDVGIKRTYVVENFNKGMIRAWHGHKKAKTLMHVIKGAVKVAALNMKNHEDVKTAVLTERKPQMFYVPAGYYNGAVSLTEGTKILVYSTLTFDEVKKDDFRESYKVRGDIWEVKNR